jgi:hypothetical protein
VVDGNRVTLYILFGDAGHCDAVDSVAVEQLIDIGQQGELYEAYSQLLNML